MVLKLLCTWIDQINEFVKRARAAKIHAYIMSQLKKEMPSWIGKTKAQQRLIDNLDSLFEKIQREHHLPAGDFPNVDSFRETLKGYNIDRFERVKSRMIHGIDDMLAYDIPNLLKTFGNPYEWLRHFRETQSLYIAIVLFHPSASFEITCSRMLGMSHLLFLLHIEDVSNGDAVFVRSMA